MSMSQLNPILLPNMNVRAENHSILAGCVRENQVRTTDQKDHPPKSFRDDWRATSFLFIVDQHQTGRLRSGIFPVFENSLKRH